MKLKVVHKGGPLKEGLTRTGPVGLGKLDCPAQRRGKGDLPFRFGKIHFQGRVQPRGLLASGKEATEKGTKPKS